MQNSSFCTLELKLEGGVAKEIPTATPGIVQQNRILLC